MTWTKVARRGAGRRRRVPGVEGLESRQLLAVTFTLPAIGATTNALTVGLDRNIWFAGSGGIGAINPANGFVGQVKLPAAIRNFEGIVYGKDNNVYVADGTTSAVGVYQPATGAYTEYPTPTANSGPDGIATTADGTIWFTESAAGKIASLNPTTHAIAEYPLKSLNESPSGIVVGPDGDLWFTEVNDQRIGQFDPTKHAIAEFVASLPSPGIAVGPDGDLWFGSGTNIAEIDPTSHAIATYPSELFNLTAFTTGPDGKVYYTGDVPGTEFGGTDEIGSIDPTTHTVSLSPMPSTPLGGGLIPTPIVPAAIVTGPDANLWYGFPSTFSATIGKATVIPANRAAIAGTVSPATGETVFLDLKGTGALAPGDPTAATDANGYYTFAGLTPGTYTVRVAYAGNIVVSQASGPTVTVAGGQLGLPPVISVLATSSILPLAYSANPFGTHNPDISTAEVVGLYKTILNRAPTAPELNAYVSYLKGGGQLQAVASVLLHSDEYEGYLIAIDYANILGRTAASWEVAAWVKVIDQQHLSAEQVAYYLMTSAEFNAAHADGASFINVVYENVLGRQAAAFENSAWQSVLSAGTSRAAMFNAMIHSTFAARRAAEGFAAIFWLSDLDATTEQYVVNHLVGGGTQADLASAFASLPGFVQRANATVG